MKIKLAILSLLTTITFADMSFEMNNSEAGTCYFAKLSKFSKLQVKLIEQVENGSVFVEVKLKSAFTKTSGIAVQTYGDDGKFQLENDGGVFLLERAADDVLTLSSDNSPVSRGALRSLAFHGNNKTDIDLKESKCF